MRNGECAKVTKIEKVPCILHGGKPGTIDIAWGTDEFGGLHMWDCETGSRAPSRKGQIKRHDLVERL